METKPNHIDENSGPIEWIVSAGWESIITGAGAPDWSRLHSTNGAQLIKSSPVRRVWCVRVGDRTVFVKEFASPTFRDVVRSFLRGSDAVREWDAGAEATRCGVPCVKFVARGVSRTRSYLISEAVEGAVRFSDSWRHVMSLRDADDRKQLGNALTTAVAHLLAHAHERGFSHNDEHPDNVLVVADGPNRFKAQYVDIARAKVSGPLDEKQAARCLAQLHQWFQQRASKTERMRLIRVYCNARCHGDIGRARRLLRRISKEAIEATHELATALWAKRDRRILRTNAYFAKLKLSDGREAHVALKFRQRDAYPPAGVNDLSPEAWMEILTDAKMIVGSRIQPGDPRHCMRVTIHDGNTPDDALLQRFIMSHRLFHRDIPCRRAAAFVERQGRHSAELWFDPTPPAQDLIEYLKPSTGDLAARRRVLRSLGELVGLMSEQGAFVREAGKSTFGVDVANRLSLVEDTTNIGVHDRNPKPDRLRTSRAILVMAIRESLFRRTDAVRFLKAAAPWRWKRVWRRIASG